MSVDSSRVIDESVFGKKEEIIPLLLLLQFGESGQLSTNAFSRPACTTSKSLS